MDINRFLSLIKIKKQTIASVMILFLAIAAIISFCQPLKYSSKSSVLVIQNFPAGTDPSSISKSNEYISNILAKVVSSNLFYNDVLSAGFNVDKKYFFKKNNISAEMDKWKKTVRADAVSDTGIVNINVYHPDKEQLSQIAMAVNYILQSRHSQYHSLGNNITAKIIDKPVSSVWPTKPNLALNLSLALALGLIVSLYYIYLFQEESYNLRLWPKLRGRKIKEERIFNNQYISLNNHSAELNQAEQGGGSSHDFRAEQADPKTSSPEENVNAETQSRENQTSERPDLKAGETTGNGNGQAEQNYAFLAGNMGNILGK